MKWKRRQSTKSRRKCNTRGSSPTRPDPTRVDSTIAILSLDFSRFLSLGFWSFGILDFNEFSDLGIRIFLIQPRVDPDLSRPNHPIFHKKQLLWQAARTKRRRWLGHGSTRLWQRMHPTSLRTQKTVSTLVRYSTSRRCSIVFSPGPGLFMIFGVWIFSGFWVWGFVVLGFRILMSFGILEFRCVWCRICRVCSFGISDFGKF